MMSLSMQNWRQLRLPLALLGSALIIATLLYSYTETHRAEAHRLLLDQQRAYAQARSRYLASGTEKADIANFLPAYRRLEKLGFIGEERRVDWIDQLRDISRRNKLFAITYDIGIQQDYQPAALNTGPFKLHRSIMTLKFDMLHEGDLVTLLQALQADNSQTLMLRDCVITRKAASTQAPNLDAGCEMDWLTLTKPLKGERP